MTHSSKPSDKVDLIFDWPCILLMLVLAKRKKLKLLEDQVPPVYTAVDKFLPVQHVYTVPDKFCFRLQYCLLFKNLHASVAGASRHSPILPG